MARPSFHGIFSSMNTNDATSSASAAEASWPPSAASDQQQRTAQRGQVAVDIFEYDNYYIVKAPIAGVKLSDIDIEITDNVLTIRGARKQSDDIPHNQYYLQECYWGEFSRSITLPFQIDPKKIKATFNKECILKILIPKEEKVKIVRISE